jgi:hypothetical protein
MAAREGKEATGQLLQNIQDQLNRLISQLSDLEEMKADLDEDEYTSTKTETLQQLKEFEKSLQKTLAGNLSLVDSLSAVRLAIQGAISNAFKTPEVIRMFANKQPAQLRFKLAELQREHKLKNVDKMSFTSQVTTRLCFYALDATHPVFNFVICFLFRLSKYWLLSSV